MLQLLLDIITYSRCYEHDKTTGTIGSGSMITASRIQGTWELVSLMYRNHGVRDHVMDREDREDREGISSVPPVPENEGSI